VNTANGKINITAPTNGVASNPSVTTGKTKAQLSQSGVVGPEYSIVAGDVVQLTASNYSASAVGAFQPGKIRVRFNINITNALAGVQLITPTFPVPPAGVTGLFLFPFEEVVTTTSGGVSVGGDGTSVIVEQPSYGAVAPSTDWAGAAFNFFNDTGCPAGSNDCYPYQTYTQPLSPGSTSEAHTVGFDIDPTVANFRARLIVAADLQNSGPAPTGTVSGSVTSPQRGALNGVTVTVTSGGFTGTTAGAGAYSIPNVTTGPKTVALSNLPSGCTDPGPQTTTVSSGGTSTVNFTVVCSALTGTVSGSFTRTGPNSAVSLGGTIVTATPAASGTSASPVTLGAGATNYSIPAVQIGLGAGAGNGAVALSNLPAGCTAAPGSYTGLTAGGTQTVNFTIDCQTPPSSYQYTTAWGTISGGSVNLTVTFDPTTRNDPGVNGAAADDFKTIQGTITYPSARLSAQSCVNGAGSTFTNINANTSTLGSIAFLNFKNGAGATTAQIIAVCTFTVSGTGGGSASTSTAFDVVSPDGTGDTVSDLRPNVQQNNGSLALP
jgi:hypothetical protein